MTGEGQSVALQGVPAPWNVPPLAVQLAWVVWKQKPLGAQHAPSWSFPPQGLPAHKASGWNVPPLLAQCVCVVMKHPPFGPQHAPIAPWQVVTLQWLSAPWNSPPRFSHCCGVVMMQGGAPKIGGRQHAPVPPGGAHNVGLHCVFGWNVPPIEAHWIGVDCWQPPLGPQHAPVGGGGAQMMLLHKVLG